MARDQPRRVDPTPDTAVPWDDEDLPQRPEHDWSALRRWRRPVGVLVLASAIGLGAWRLATLDGTDATVADDTPVASARPGDLRAAGITVAARAPSRDNNVFGEVPSCPANRSCATTSALPPRVAVAVQRVYAGARIVRSATVTMHASTRTLLWSRSITARVGARTVDVQVTSQGRELESGTLGGGTEVLVYVERFNGPYIVRVAVAGPASGSARVTRDAARLAVDPRVVLLP